MPELEKKETNPQVTELQKQLEEANKRLDEESQARKAVMDDPDLKAVLEARARNQKVKIEIGTQDTPASNKSIQQRVAEQSGQVDDDAKLESLSNSQLVDIMSSSIEEVVAERVAQVLESVEADVDAKMGVLVGNQKKLRDALINQAAMTGTATMRGAYQDYDEYHKEVQDIMTTQGLNQEDAYLLAKARAGKTVPDRRRIDSERPTTVARRTSRSRVDDRGDGQDIIQRRTQSSSARFSDLVRSAVEKHAG